MALLSVWMRKPVRNQVRSLRSLRVRAAPLSQV
jgi:hypothetical protein